MKHETRDGHEIVIGMRVFTYDWSYGEVLDTRNNRDILEGTVHEPHPNSGTCENAWFEVRNESGTLEGKVNVYDCSRLWKEKPRG